MSRTLKGNLLGVTSSNGRRKRRNFLLNSFPYLSLPQPVCTQKGLLEQMSTGANNVDAAPGPAGGARHRASSVYPPKLPSLKGSLSSVNWDQSERDHSV